MHAFVVSHGNFEIIMGINFLKDVQASIQFRSGDSPSVFTMYGDNSDKPISTCLEPARKSGYVSEHFHTDGVSVSGVRSSIGFLAEKGIIEELEANELIFSKDIEEELLQCAALDKINQHFRQTGILEPGEFVIYGSGEPEELTNYHNVTSGELEDLRDEHFCWKDDELEFFNIDKTKYKPVGVKVIPEGRLSSGPAPVVDGFYKGFVPEDRTLTRERLEKMENIGDLKLITKEERGVLIDEVVSHSNAFSERLDQIGRVSNKLVRDYVLPVKEHKPWQLKAYPIPMR
jgi:hypothetical protein